MPIAMAVIGGAVWFGMDKMPGSVLKDRFSTLGAMQEDGSSKRGWTSIPTAFTILEPGRFRPWCDGAFQPYQYWRRVQYRCDNDAGYVEIVAQHGWLGAI
jgi:hypothetical protein